MLFKTKQQNRSAPPSRVAVEYSVEKAPDNSDHGVGFLFVEFERRECLIKRDDLGGLIFCVLF